MTYPRCHRSACAVLLLASASWMGVSCSSDSDDDSDNQNSAAPPPTTLQLTISPQGNYAYPGEREDYQVTCNDSKFLPDEFVCMTYFVDPTGKIVESYPFLHTHIDLQKPTQLNSFVVTFSEVADYTVMAKLFSSAAGDVAEILGEQGFEELNRLISPTAEATAMLRVRDTALEIQYTADSSGLTYTFTVEWTDSDYWNWYTQRIPPSSLAYRWYFDDQDQPITESGNRIEHTFDTGGTHTVTAKLWLRENFKEIQGTANIVVGADQTLTLVRPEGDLIVNTDYVFQAAYSGLLPEDPYYEWLFGEGIGTLGIPFSNEATHAFPTAGTHTVAVSLFSEENGLLLAEASADVYIHPDRTARLLQAIKATGFRASINSHKNFANRDGSALESAYCGCSWSGGGFGCNMFYCKVTSEQMQWNGLAFSVNLNENLSDTPIAGVTRKRTVDITGSISGDAATLVALSVHETINDTYTVDGSVRLSYEQSFEVADAELSNLNGLSTFLFSTEDSPDLPSNYSIQGGVYGQEAATYVDNMSLDCLFYAATTWDYSYLDSDWPDGTNFTVSFEN